MDEVTELWINFLDNEKLSADRVDPQSQPRLLALAEELAKKRRPKIKPYAQKLISRRVVVETAMDMSFDLTGIKHKGKPAISRSLLDAWNIVYKERFGTTFGTAAEKEVKRRDIKLRPKQ